MRNWPAEIGNRGVTLIELLVVVTVVGILALVLAFNYQGWMGNYKIESQTKNLYSDLMDAKSMAMTRGVTYFMTLDATGYQMFSDNNNNGTYQAGTDTAVWPQRILSEGRQMVMISGGAFPVTITFDTRGLMWPAAGMSFRIDRTDMTPDYDCIAVNQASIRMGQWDGGANCVEK